jgi:hypothetical protein
VAGSCGHGDKPSGSIKGGEFLTSFATIKVLKVDSVPWS